MKELTDSEILMEATDYKLDNIMVFGCVSELNEFFPNLPPFKQFTIVKIAEDDFKKNTYRLKLTTGHYTPDTNEISLSNFSSSHIRVTNITDAQNIAKAITNSDIAY